MCIYDLFTLLGGTPDTGGTWDITFATGGSFIGTVDGVQSTVNIGSTVGTDHTPEIGINTTTLAGQYIFRYTVGSGSCIAQANVIVNVLEGVGDDVTNTICTDDTGTITIGADLGGQADPTSGNYNSANWTLTGSPTGWNATTAIQTLPLAAGTYTYTYDVAGADPACDSCGATYTLNVLAGGNAGTSGNVTVCNEI